MVGNTVVGRLRDDRSGVGESHVKFINFGQDGSILHTGTMYMYNNTCVTADSRNALVWLHDTSGVSSKAVVSNNIFYGSQTIVYSDTPAGSLVGANNWMPTGASTSPGTFSGTTYGGNPGFVDVAGRDFRLVATAGARDKSASPLTYVDGSGVTRTLTVDESYLLGTGQVWRAAFRASDLGAYEFVWPGDANLDGSVSVLDL